MTLPPERGWRVRTPARVETVFQTHRDPLTGLRTREQFVSELEHLLKAGSGDRVGYGLVLVDVDDFKSVNHALGYTVGDQYLIHVGRVVGEHAGGSDLTARIGSDEFGLLLVDVDEARTVLIAEGLRHALYNRALGKPIHVSAGVVTLNASHALTAGAALACADAALADAKARGGARTIVHRPAEMTTLAWISRIRDAITNDRLVLHAQPILDLTRNVVKCHELLVRMLDDDGQLIPPGEFIPLAERFGLIGEIDRWVLAQGLGLARCGRSVTINLSAHSLCDPTIVPVVRDAVVAGLDTGNVIFEVTETAAFENATEAVRLAHALVEIGCELALDDFGTGFSSFTNLKLLPARYVKIDAEFVRHAGADEKDGAIVQLICGVAHVLGKETIAEGVEDADTLEILRQLGVDHAQGYFIGRPEPIAPAPPSCGEQSR